MSKRHLGNGKRFESLVIEGYRLEKCVHGGNNGLIFHAVRDDIGHAVACKLIPHQNLRSGWEVELTKATKLSDIEQVVSYIRHGTVQIENQEWVWIFWRWVNGSNLNDYVYKHPDNITIPFILTVLNSLLRVFVALKAHGISHGDLHSGNVLIAEPDDSMYDSVPRIKVTDFGIGCSLNGLTPKDDYEGLARICADLLSLLEPAELQPEDKYHYYELGTFLNKEILERNVTAGEFVREPRGLLDRLNAIPSEYHRRPVGATMVHPFDYLSCEQIGDSFEKLRSLYSGKFLGSLDLVQFTNTVLTGPRGCGKTTVFRNLSIIPQLMTDQLSAVEEKYIGIYYYCSDLYYAFPYLKGEQLSEYQARATVHYLNVALLRELMEALLVIEEKVRPSTLSGKAVTKIEEFISSHFPSFIRLPIGAVTLRHIKSFAERQKVLTKRLVERARTSKDLPEDFTGLDFIKQLCGLLQREIPLLHDKPIFFFLDDYSTPKVSDAIQASLHRVIFQRNPECFFKVSTESVTTLSPIDYDGKLLEETREYDLIDLGAYFLNATEKDRSDFLVEVINNRLRLADTISHKDIRSILGSPSFDNQTRLAENIRRGDKVYYNGLDTVVNLCSGDVMSILRLIRDMFAQGLPDSPDALPIPRDQQDKQVRKLGADFLHKIESAPEFGPLMKRVALAFGDIAHFQMINLDSPNQGATPPKQAFRIEIRETLTFPDNQTKKLYQELIRYGVFIRDVRGKSVRGSVVPRLYLRRLLIPTFKLTFSQRDNIGLEPKDFLLLLETPEQFTSMMRKRTLKGEPPEPPESPIQGRLNI